MDATLQMLRSRMGRVEIERDYEPDLPRISAYGGELNQVWTALIENALEALGAAGVPTDRSSSVGWKAGVPTSPGPPESDLDSLGWRDRSSSVGWQPGPLARHLQA